MNLTSQGITYQVNTVEYLNFPNLKKKTESFWLSALYFNLKLKQQTKWEGNTVEPPLGNTPQDTVTT